MKETETRRLEMFLRVRGFGEAQAARFPEGTLAHELFERLRRTITALEQHASAQVSGKNTASQGATTKSVARDDLRRSLEAISRTARAMALSTPGLENKFRAPRNLRDHDLLNLARSFAADALPLKDEFQRRGMAASFVEDLNTDIGEFESAIQSKNQGREAHVAATAAIDELIEQGMNAVRELDAVMRNTYANDTATLAAWLSASHTERNSRSARNKKPDAGTPPPGGSEQKPAVQG